MKAHAGDRVCRGVRKGSIFFWYEDDPTNFRILWDDGGESWENADDLEPLEGFSK